MGLFNFKTDTIQDVKVPCLLKKRIGDGRYYLDKKLGCGGYSVVYRAIDLDQELLDGQSPEFVAVKCVLARDKIRNLHEYDLQRYASERIPGVVQVYDIFDEGSLCFVIMEYCAGGDLFSAITEEKMFAWCDRGIRQIFLEILDTVSALHDIGIYHRDLKPENFLLTEDYQSVRLADFGLSTTHELSKSLQCGSFLYMSPECLYGDLIDGVEAYSTRAADIWALGVVLVNMITGAPPWQRAETVDRAFKLFSLDQEQYLTTVFPLSPGAVAFCNAIFRSHGKHICLKKLAREFARIGTFFMSEEQIEQSSRTVKKITAKLKLVENYQPFTASEIRSMNESLGEPAAHVDALSTKIEVIDENSSSTDEAGCVCESTSEASNMGLVPDNSTENSSSKGPITPETRPVKFDEGHRKQICSPIAGQSWARPTWLLDASLKKTHTHAEILSGDIDDMDSSIEQLVI